MFDTRVPYDKSSVIWSPEGELVQLAYARRASEKGQPAIGLILDDSTILLATKTNCDDLVQKPPKIQLIDECLYLLASGLLSDANLLLTQSRLINQRHELIYNEKIGPEGLTRKLGEIMANHTLSGGLRAFGVMLLIAGFDPISKKPQILSLDNGGSYISVKAWASGQDSYKLISYFREHYKKGVSIEEGKKLVLDALNNIIEKPTNKIEEKDMEFQIVKPVSKEDL